MMTNEILRSASETLREQFGFDDDGNKTVLRIFGREVWAWSDEANEDNPAFETHPAIELRTTVNVLAAECRKRPYYGQIVEWAGRKWNISTVRGIGCPEFAIELVAHR